MDETHWTTTFREGEDGGGVIEIPAHVLRGLGWTPDCQVEIEVLADGRFRVSQKDAQ